MQRNFSSLQKCKESGFELNSDIRFDVKQAEYICLMKLIRFIY